MVTSGSEALFSLNFPVHASFLHLSCANPPLQSIHISVCNTDPFVSNQTLLIHTCACAQTCICKMQTVFTVYFWVYNGTEGVREKKRRDGNATMCWVMEIFQVPQVILIYSQGWESQVNFFFLPCHMHCSQLMAFQCINFMIAEFPSVLFIACQHLKHALV